MLQSLSRNGILIETLFLVEGDLIEHYNRALETVIGKRTQQTSFHIDKRGESPQLEVELGKNYLQTGPSHRYCIVVSPEQKEADLIHEEFSFDYEMLDLLYEYHLAGISLATRVDVLYGEIDDGVREFETFEDLLLTNTIHLELCTPSRFLYKARELKTYADQLRANPELLIENNSALPKRILEQVKEVGDIRDYDLRPIEITKENIQTFCTRLFGGVCIFRNIRLRHEQEEFIYGLSGEPLTDVSSGTDNESIHSPSSKAVVIYRQKDDQPEDGPLVTFIPFQDKVRVVNFLVDYGYADYSYELLEPALNRIEDETLLQKGHDVSGMVTQQRIQVLHQYKDAMIFAWYELKDLKRSVTKGHDFQDVVRKCSAEVQSLLLSSRTSDSSTSHVVEHVLTRLNEYQYEKMLAYNRRHLERLYMGSDQNKQHYIISEVTKKS